jgi:hypothetical protein
MIRTSFAVLCAVLSILASAPAGQTAQAPPSVKPNTVAGTGTYAGETLTFSHGLAWSGQDGVKVALFDRQPRPTILAELRKGSWGDGGPTATLTFDLESGKSGPSAVTYCVVGLHFPKSGPMTWNAASPDGCGLTALSGTLAPGGTITAVLKGSKSMQNEKPMGWDLRFNLPIAK